MRRGEAAHIEGAQEVRLHNGADVVQVDIAEALALADDARDVNEHVDAPALGNTRLDRPAAIVLNRDVAAHETALP